MSTRDEFDSSWRQARPTTSGEPNQLRTYSATFQPAVLKLILVSQQDPLVVLNLLQNAIRHNTGPSDRIDRAVVDDRQGE